MTLLLYLGLTRRQYWQRTAQGWQALNEQPRPNQPVWVVTNLAEEGYAEIDIPRVFGKDRTDLLQRQLAGHFPETDYRARLNLPHGLSLLDKFAPTRHTLFGITNAKKIDDILDEENIQVAALCPTSMLLTRLARHRSLPETLFVVISDTESIRIVFIKNRIPHLTRLAAIPVSVSASHQVDAQIEEIIRTHRYLENTRALRKDEHLSVLLLGDAAEFSAPLSRAGLTIVAPPSSWNTAAPAHAWHPVFDLAIHKQPYGQLAPMARRTRFLASRMRRYAWITSACLVLFGMAIASLHMNDMLSTLHETEQASTAMGTLNQQNAELDRQIDALGANSDLVHRALALDTREILEAPSFGHQLTQIAQALHEATQISNAPNASLATQPIRLSRMDWTLLAPGATPCADDQTTLPKNGVPGVHAAMPASSPPSPSTSSSTSPPPFSAAGDATTPQQAQISFDLSLPPGISPRSRLDRVRSISAHLQDIPNLQLLGDPNVSLGHATLKGGAQSSTDETRLRWCMTLPGPTPVSGSQTP